MWVCYARLLQTAGVGPKMYPMNFKRSFETTAVHAGDDRSKDHGALSTPIYTASVFAFSDVERGIAIHNFEAPGYFYGRLGNPTQEVLERAVAELEGAEDALAFASGMAAISAAVFTFAKQGDHIVAPQSMYSTAANLFHYLAEGFGIDSTFVEATDASAYRSAARPNTRIFWIETPSNPLVQITDVRSVAAAARELGIATVADNTFATPYNQRPLELGVDVSIHSATKYLGGHSDLTVGVMVGSKETIERARHKPSKYFGGNIAPQVAWLVLRGIKTLALRMERHNLNALAVAEALSLDLGPEAVYYPGLPHHRNHDVAKDQMTGFGGMAAIDLKTAEAAKKFVGSVKLCTFATSLGGVETIVQPAALMTHATLSPEERSAAGISDGLIRISVGIENVDDIIADIRQAISS
ncbi:MAG TPA: aminotransferase class I/II-fold pyridoxal phosphate-dependent enzyme [Pyrinomonadaceae bacterium]|nr:aminotransferase class I/II-fold pyridoxal phosphate-dependent enzyme [Pyrinomonadaceae bacterium]